MDDYICDDKARIKKEESERVEVELVPSKLIQVFGEPLRTWELKISGMYYFRHIPTGTPFLIYDYRETDPFRGVVAQPHEPVGMVEYTDAVVAFQRKNKKKLTYETVRKFREFVLTLMRAMDPNLRPAAADDEDESEEQEPSPEAFWALEIPRPFSVCTEEGRENLLPDFITWLKSKAG